MSGRGILEEMVGVKRYSFGQDKAWMGRPEEVLRAFGLGLEGWREEAQKAGRWLQGAEDGAGDHMQK